MYIMTVDVGRVDLGVVTTLHLINTDSCNGIISKTLKGQRSFEELTHDIAKVVADMRPSRLIVDNKGVGNAIDDMLAKELSSYDAIWYKDASVFYKDKERK